MADIEQLVKEYTVLSLFDGISCGHLAFDKAGIKVGKYFASEIKKDGIKVAKDNYPDTIHIGNVKNVSYSDGRLHFEPLGDDFKPLEKTSVETKIDILIGGSPCQGFSVAGKRLNFDDHRSVLFFEYLRILRETKPKYFLLENVKMKKEIQDAISKELGVEPININSKLVSGQLRNRFYWTNIPGVGMPEDKGITLQSILTSGFTDREKARALLESDSRPLKSKDKMMRRYKITGFTTIVYENGVEDVENVRYLNQTELERCQTVPDGYTKVLNRNDAAGVLGDGWTVDAIAHIFSYLKKAELSINQK